MGDGAPPETATSPPAPTSLTARRGRALWHWRKSRVTGDLKSLKIRVHHISQEEAASAGHLG